MVDFRAMSGSFTKLLLSHITSSLPKARLIKDRGTMPPRSFIRLNNPIPIHPELEPAKKTVVIGTGLLPESQRSQFFVTNMHIFPSFSHFPTSSSGPFPSPFLQHQQFPLSTLVLLVSHFSLHSVNDNSSSLFHYIFYATSPFSFSHFCLRQILPNRPRRMAVHFLPLLHSSFSHLFRLFPGGRLPFA
jgi:hypothetical protein